MTSTVAKSLIRIALVTLLGAAAVRAQSPYFQAVTNLHPAGYWPMHDVGAAAVGDVETNHGTLGSLGNGYYSDWETNNLATTKIIHSMPGALANDSDPSVFFLAPGAGGAAGNQSLIVPHTSPQLTLKPPFTLEAWVYPTNTTAFGVIIGEGGNAGLNGTNNFDGFQMGFGANELQMQYYTGVAGGSANHVTAASYVTNHWYHCVVTYDGINTHMYVNGADVKDAVDTMAPSTWSPLVIGSGKWGAGPIRNLVGVVDEVAIYTNVITDIAQHYSDGISGGAGVYVSDVLADNPILYYRMDGPAYTAPSVGTWPALANYGSTAVSGVYTPGSVPGGLVGASYSGFPSALSSANVLACNGMGSFADAGNDATYNPTGANAMFSISAIFRGNPADPRVQSICGHGTNSWQVVLNTAGKIVFNAGTGGAIGAGSASGDLTSAAVYNDGVWHQLVVTHNGTNNALYVDGVLDSTNSSSVSIPGSSGDVLIGADPSFTNNPTCIGRQFAGEVCEVAFFNSQLQLSDVQSLYSASHVPPYITRQPSSGFAIQGSGFTNTVAAGGTATLTYQWYINSDPAVIAANSNISGQTSASLVLNPVQSTDNTNYFVVVSNGYGAVTSSIVSLTVVGVPTIISQSPQTNGAPFPLYLGAAPTYSITVVGTTPLSYLWFTNGVRDTASTNATVRRTNSVLGSFSTYCVVTNLYGSATSILWQASVIADPTNTVGGPAPYPQAVLGSAPIGYWRLNESDDGNGNQGAICNDYVGGNDGTYTNVILANAIGGTGYSPSTDAEGSAFFGYWASPNSDAYGISGVDFSAANGTSKAFSVEAWAEGYAAQGSDAGVVTKGFGGGEQFDLDTGSDSGSPNHAYRFLVRDASGGLHSVPSSVNSGDNTWHHLVGVCDEPNGIISFYIDGQLIGTTPITTGSGIFASTNPMTIGARMGGATGGNNLQFLGFMNDVAVYNYALSQSQVIAHYSNVPAAPYIAQEPPSSVTVNGGGVFNISVQAFGTLPLSYRWYDNNAAAYIPGQTNATLVVSNIYANNSYYVTVTNIYGTTNSTQANVTVNNSAPTIDSQLPLTNSFTVYAAARPTFSLTASGTIPLTYYWFTNNVRNAAATTSSFTWTNLPSGTSTVYCIVSNNLGTAPSMTWTIAAVSSPTAPYPLMIMTNNPIAYWRLNEAPSGLNDTNYGVICHDYVGGNNGVYENTILGVQGFNPSADPTETCAFFTNVYPSAAYGMLYPDFTLPAGQSATLSIEFWQQGPPGYVDNGNYVSKGGSGATQFNIDNQGAGGAYAFVFHNANGAIFGPIDSGINPSDGAWHHVVGTINEFLSTSNMILYVDGVARAWSTVPQGSGVLQATNTPVYIGCSISQASGQTYGKMNDVAMYNYALSADQVTSHYQTGIATGINTSPGLISYFVATNHLILSWPADHTGWRLQSQDTLGTTNWSDVSGSTGVNQIVVPVTNASSFYRLTYP
jgi:hypothetical protein